MITVSYLSNIFYLSLEAIKSIEVIEISKA